MSKYLETQGYPLFYFMFWLSMHFTFIGYDMLIYSIYISAIYGLGHFLSARDGKIALSAEGLAMPLTAAAGLIYGIVSWSLGNFPSDIETFKHNATVIIQSLTFSILGAHLALFLVVYLYDRLFESKQY